MELRPQHADSVSNFFHVWVASGFQHQRIWQPQDQHESFRKLRQHRSLCSCSIRWRLKGARYRHVYWTACAQNVSKKYSRTIPRQTDSYACTLHMAQCSLHRVICATHASAYDCDGRHIPAMLWAMLPFLMHPGCFALCI